MNRLPDQAGLPGTAAAPVLLAVDTAGSACCAALACGGTILASERREMRHGHGEALLPMIDRVTAAAGVPAARIGVVAVTTGPGGFTGIRVGLAAAHGIALATGARLIGITSFAAVASLAGETAGKPLLVALDSRREDLYVQLFDPAGDRPLTEPAAVLPAGLADWLGAAGLPPATPLLIAGDAAGAAAAALAARAGDTMVRRLAPDALGAAAAALRVLRDGGPIVPVRPLYLRPPDVTLPRRRPAATAVP